MQLVNLGWYAYGFLRSPEKNRADAIPPLTDEEKACFDKIVKDLLRYCKDRLYLPSLSSKSLISSNYVLIFRQSESWRTVEKMFHEAQPNLANHAQQICVSNWLKRISVMRSLHHQIHDSAARISQWKDQRTHNLSEHDENYISEEEAERLRNIIRTSKGQILSLIREGEKDLVLNMQDPSIYSNSPLLKVLSFMREKWLNLTVVADWAEVPMDEKKLAVQVRLNPDTSAHGQLNDPLKRLVNQATKAIFFVVEKDEVLPVSYAGVERGAQIRPKEMALKRASFGPPSPTPIKRSSSQVALAPVECYFDYQISDESGIYRLEKPSMTSLASRLETIVQQALNVVNQRLSNNDGLTSLSSDDIQKVAMSQNPSGGVSLFFSFFSKWAWTGAPIREEDGSES